MITEISCCMDPINPLYGTDSPATRLIHASSEELTKGEGGGPPSEDSIGLLEEGRVSDERRRRAWVLSRSRHTSPGGWEGPSTGPPPPLHAQLRMPRRLPELGDLELAVGGQSYTGAFAFPEEVPAPAPAPVALSSSPRGSRPREQAGGARRSGQAAAPQPTAVAEPAGLPPPPPPPKRMKQRAEEVPAPVPGREGSELPRAEELPSALGEAGAPAGAGQEEAELPHAVPLLLVLPDRTDLNAQLAAAFSSSERDPALAWPGLRDPDRRR